MCIEFVYALFSICKWSPIWFSHALHMIYVGFWYAFLRSGLSDLSPTRREIFHMWYELQRKLFICDTSYKGVEDEIRDVYLKFS